MCLAFIVGLVLIFVAPIIWTSGEALSSIVQHNGGSMDGTMVQIAVSGKIVSFQFSGLVISLVSGFGMIAGAYVLYKEILL